MSILADFRLHGNDKRMKGLLTKAKKLPLKPGTYIFLGLDNNPLYVGRATLLRRRVSNYFTDRVDERIKEMVGLAKDIKYIETDSVLEAIILEANLIKKYWPKYNVKDRDDRSFVYIAISKKDDFPKPIILRGRQVIGDQLLRDSSYVFGPYQSLSMVNHALKIIRKIFPYSTCKPFDKNQGKSFKPCFYYQIGLCPGVCVGKIPKKVYQKNIKDIVLLLSGEKKRLLAKLKKENPDKIKALKHIQDVALLADNQQPAINNLEIKRIEGYDISHLSGKETYGSMVVFEDGNSDSSKYRLFKIKDAAHNDDLRALEETLSRRLKHKEWPLPDLILIDGGRPQVDFIAKLFERKNISIPFVGISKFGDDKLVFGAKVKKKARLEIIAARPILLAVRDEAHRFAKKASIRKRRKIKWKLIETD